MRVSVAFSSYSAHLHSYDVIFLVILQEFRPVSIYIWSASAQVICTREQLNTFSLTALHASSGVQHKTQLKEQMGSPLSMHCKCVWERISEGEIKRQWENETDTQQSLEVVC